MMSVTSIFRWSGEYLGFLHDGWLFDAGSRYLGWYGPDGRVWAADGRYLGERVDENFILRRADFTAPVPQVPRAPPVPPTPPQAPGPRLANKPRPGWMDALSEIGWLPSREDLLGPWRLDGMQLSLDPDGSYVWQVVGEEPVQGEWNASGRYLRVFPPGEGERKPVIYWIVAYVRDALTLREVTEEAGNPPFTLSRAPV